jgi:hypothetical protein
MGPRIEATYAGRCLVGDARRLAFQFGMRLFRFWLSNRLRLGILWLKAIILLVAKYEINMAESVCNKERSLLCFEGLDVGLDCVQSR